MKKKFILAIFGISLLFVACQEDTYFDEYYVDDSNSSILTETMKLIGDNYDHVTLPDLEKTLGGNTATRGRGGKKHSLSLEDEDFTFDWNNAEIISSSKAEAAIVPVKQKKEMALQSVVAKGNLHREETTPLHSILYVRKFLNEGKSYTHILSFAPDRDYANACEERGEEMQLYPNPQGSNYSGILFVSTIYGEISHGIRYENGRMCHYILPRSEKNRDFIERYRSEHSECHGTEHCDSTHTRMSMNFITVSSATRSTYSTRSEYGGGSSGSSSGSGYNCSFCGKDVYDCTCVEIVACGVCKKDPCVCYENMEPEEEEKCVYCGFLKEYCQCYNDSWQDDYGNSHGPNPGNPYPNNPGNNSGGNSGNDEDITVTPNSLLKSIGIVKSTISGSDLETLNKCIKAFNSIIYYEELYKLLSARNPNVYFTIEEKFVNGEPIEAGFIRADNTIYFFSSDKIIEGYLTEELLHAIQFHSFYGNTMGDYAMGNIELEVKMVKDVINRLTKNPYCPSCGYITDNQLSTDYEMWLIEGDYTNHSEWYDRLLPNFKYNNAKTDTSKVAHPMLDWLYNYIINNHQK